MFWLDQKEEVVKDYIKGVGKEVKKLIEQEEKKSHRPECQRILSEMLRKESEFYYKKILGMRPESMMEFYKKWTGVFAMEEKGVSVYETGTGMGVKKESELSKMLKRCYSYAIFSEKSCTWEWNAYQLTEKLQTEVCPYCNRQFIHTVKVKKGNVKIMRGELDHYFPKSRFPMFALSFYNLIPSCHFCNASIKGTNELSIENNIHPYVKSDADFKFQYNRAKKEVELSFFNDTDKKVEKTCNFFKIAEVYSCHADIAEHYWKEAETFSEDMAEEYQEFLKEKMGMNYSKERIYQEKFRITPHTKDEILGKFRTDIVSEIVAKYEKN